MYITTTTTTTPIQVAMVATVIGVVLSENIDILSNYVLELTFQNMVYLFKNYKFSLLKAIPFFFFQYISFKFP